MNYLTIFSYIDSSTWFVIQCLKLSWLYNFGMLSAANNGISSWCALRSKSNVIYQKLRCDCTSPQQYNRVTKHPMLSLSFLSLHSSGRLWTIYLLSGGILAVGPTARFFQFCSHQMCWLFAPRLVASSLQHDPRRLKWPITIKTIRKTRPPLAGFLFPPCLLSENSLSPAVSGQTPVSPLASRKAGEWVHGCYS